MCSGGGGTTADNVNSSVAVSGPVNGTGVTANTVNGDVARMWFTHTFNGNDAERSFKVLALCAGNDG
jgi:hypothetical protein